MTKRKENPLIKQELIDWNKLKHITQHESEEDSVDLDAYIEALEEYSKSKDNNKVIDKVDFKSFIKYSKDKYNRERNSQPDFIYEDEDEDGNMIIVELKRQLKNEIKEDLYDDLKKELYNELKSEIKGELKKELADNLEDEIEDDVKLSLKNALLEYYTNCYQKGFNSNETTTKLINDYINVGNLFAGAGKVCENTSNYYSEIINERMEHNFENYVLISNVKDYLDKDRRTQKWLAEKTQIPQSSLSLILKGSAPISLQYAMRISMVMGRPINELFYYTDIITETD